MPWLTKPPVTGLATSSSRLHASEGRLEDLIGSLTSNPGIFGLTFPKLSLEENETMRRNLTAKCKEPERSYQIFTRSWRGSKRPILTALTSGQNKCWLH